MDEAVSRLLCLLEEYGRRLHVVLCRITLREDVAEELLQDLFLKLASSSGFAGANQPERYLFRAAIHLAFDWRKRCTASTPGESSLEMAVDRSPEASLVIEQHEELTRVLQAVEQLPPDDRDLIVLRFLHGSSYEELASQFDSTPHRLRAACSRIIARLREQLTTTGQIVRGDT